MVQFFAMFNPEWPESDALIQLGEPSDDPDVVRDRLAKAVREQYGKTSTASDSAMSWQSNLHGSLRMGKHGDLRHGYIKIVISEVEQLENELAQLNASISSTEIHLSILKEARFVVQNKLANEKEGGSHE